MSEGPYRNMSYEDAASAMRRIYKLLRYRKFHSYNTSLSEPFANYVGTRDENSNDLSEIDELYGKIGEVVNKFEPILGDISYAESDNPLEHTPPGTNNKSKVILDLHGMAILNSLLEVAELGARYINVVKRQITAIKNGTTGSTPLAQGNKIAYQYISVVDNVNSEYILKNGSDTFKRVENMINKLSSVSRSGVMAKNVNVITNVFEYQVGQEEVISDAFDKDFIEYFIMYLEAENLFHENVKSDYDDNINKVRTEENEYYWLYRANTTGSGVGQSSVNKKQPQKIARYIDVSGCRESCVGLCAGSCANTCFGCTDKCSGQCTKTCSDCDNACMTNCGATCQGTCSEECIGCNKQCGGGCIDNCTSGCGNTCKEQCHADCVGSCYGTTEGYTSVCAECGATCKGTCGNSCESESSSITPGPDPKPTDTEIIIPVKKSDPPVVNEVPKRQTSLVSTEPSGPPSHPSSGWVSTGGTTGYWVYNDGNGNSYRTDERSSFMNGQTTSSHTTPWGGGPSNDRFYQSGSSSGTGSNSGSGNAWYDRGNTSNGSPWHGNNR